MRRGLGIAALLLAAPTLGTPAVAGKADNSVRFAAQQTLPSLDKYFSQGTTAGIVSESIWDTLIYREPDSGEYKGNLATGWQWIDDKTLELDLRHGVKFHDGADFDADDVVYTLSLAAHPERSVALSRLGTWIERVEKRGPYKVRIVTKKPFPAAIGNLASPDNPIYPHAYYAAVGSKGMNQSPIGSGPYRVVEHSVGKYVRLERNREYFRDSPKPQPKIDKVEIRFLPDPQTRVAEIVAGGIDLIMDVVRDQAEQLHSVSSLQIISGKSGNVATLRMNTLPTTPAAPLRDLRVRQAIMHAIDRETMVKFMVGGGARVLHAVCHPIEFGCDDSTVPRYRYDPAKARQLLADAGFKNGFELDLYAFSDRNQSEAIINYLGAVGIKARLRFMQNAAVISAKRSGRVALYQTSWLSQPVDVSHEVAVYHEFGVDDFNKDAEVRDLLLKGDLSMDPSVRKDAYAKALRLIAQRGYALPLYSTPIYYVANKDLVLKAHTDNRPRFYEMSWK